MEGQYKCNCTAGYAGDRCEKDIDECADLVCENAATCIDHVGFAMCLCTDGFFGLFSFLLYFHCAPGIYNSSKITIFYFKITVRYIYKFMFEIIRGAMREFNVQQ